jgi:hypothetical protein
MMLETASVIWIAAIANRPGVVGGRVGCISPLQKQCEGIGDKIVARRAFS